MKYTKYEKARLVGARALQLSLGAPLLLKVSEKELEDMRYDVIALAMREVEADVILFTVKRNLPMPEARLLKKKVLIENVDAEAGPVAAVPTLHEEDVE